MPRKMTRELRYLKAVELKHGPQPINPVKLIRDELGLTLDYVSNNSGLSRQALIRTEQATYVEVPLVLLEWYSAEHSVDYLATNEAYREHQKLLRTRHWRLFGDFSFSRRLRGVVQESANSESNDLRTVHPFESLKNNWSLPNGEFLGKMNTTQCAKLLCLPQGTLSYFENNLTHQASVPRVLLDALRENGYGVEEISELMKAYVLFRSRVLNHPINENDGTPVGAYYG